jgi:hypothetical protein
MTSIILLHLMYQLLLHDINSINILLSVTNCDLADILWLFGRERSSRTILPELFSTTPYLREEDRYIPSRARRTSLVQGLKLFSREAYQVTIVRA